MMSHHPDFRDISQRLERLRYLKKPKPPTGHLNDWLQIDNHEKPVLRRYRIERRLGKGAMGVVCLGFEAKISSYEAGEEQDLITMEFFKGGNLVPIRCQIIYCQKRK
jgi:serine/threonine protein kinase